MSHEEKTILTLSLKLLQLQSIGDAAGIAELLDDDLEAIDADGCRRNKSQLLDYLLHGQLHDQPHDQLEFPSQALSLSEIRITLFDDTALETGLQISRASDGEHCYSYSRLWLQQRDALWRLRGFQLTPQTPLVPAGKTQ